MDRISPEVRSRIMSRIRSKDTKPERALRSAMWRRGLRFRKNLRGVPGTPDVAFTRSKVAVFIDGDFWHGMGAIPDSAYWRAKLERNVARDRRDDERLLAIGWFPLRIRASEIERDLGACVQRVIDTLFLAGRQWEPSE